MNDTTTIIDKRRHVGVASTLLCVGLMYLGPAGCSDDGDTGPSGAGGDAVGGSAGDDATAGAGGAGGAGAGGNDSAASCETDDGWTVGLLDYDASADQGYTLFAPLPSTTTYLIDVCGRQVHSWVGTAQPGNSVYLLENGDLLRTEKVAGSAFNQGGTGGRILRISWDGTITWQYEYATNLYRQHHDVELLPNGNIAMIAWQKKTQAEAIAAGRDPDMLQDGELWVDSIIEIAPEGTSGGTIVWEWHLWDHLVQNEFADKANYGSVADNPQLVDLNFGGPRADWNHVNGIDYNAELDQFIISVHNFGEIWVIDHDITSAEAAGPAGDILYRWGNPAAYGAGAMSDQQLFGQHDSQWIEPGLPGAGNILVFNNGMGRPDGKYSTVDEISSPVDDGGNYELSAASAYGPATTTWSYQAPTPTDFYSQNISGAQRLASGNTLICSGASGRMFEVTVDGAIVWEYVNPVTDLGPLTQGQMPPSGMGNGSNSVFRALRYPADHAGLAGRDLTPIDYIELPGS